MSVDIAKCPPRDKTAHGCELPNLDLSFPILPSFLGTQVPIQHKSWALDSLIPVVFITIRTLGKVEWCQSSPSNAAQGSLRTSEASEGMCSENLQPDTQQCKNLEKWFAFEYFHS